MLAGLLCLSTAKEGGLTSWSSSGAIYNRMLESHPAFVKVSPGVLACVCPTLCQNPVALHGDTALRYLQKAC